MCSYLYYIFYYKLCQIPTLFQLIVNPTISISGENISIIFKNTKNIPIITKQKTNIAKKNTILNAVSIYFLRIIFKYKIRLICLISGFCLILATDYTD